MPRRTSPTTSDARQGQLLGPADAPLPGMPAPLPLRPGAYACGDRVAAVLALDIAESARTREAIADWLTSLTGIRVTKAMIDAWTSTSHARHRFPVELAAAWVRATGSRRLVDVLAEQLGLQAIEGPELLHLEAGRLASALDSGRKRLRELQRLQRAAG